MHFVAKPVILAVSVTALLAASFDSDARVRVRRSTSFTPSGLPQAAVRSANSGSTASSPSPQGAALAAGAGVAAGAAIASTGPSRGDTYEQMVAKAQKSADLAAQQAQSLKDAETQRKADEEARLRKQAAAAEVGKQQREKIEAQKRAEAKLARDEQSRKAQAERERSCTIRPVMTDAEVANCKHAWSS